MPDETVTPPRKHNFFLWIGLCCLLLVAAFFLTAPMVIRAQKKSDLTAAVNNARQIGLALLEFEQSYGGLPSDSTSQEVIANTGSRLTLGSKTSNDIFRQLIAAEITQSEAMFYANIPQARKPDNRFTDSQALEKGECGFSYLIGATKESPHEIPLVVTPLLTGKALFDYKGTKKTFTERAAVLRYDGSVQTPSIDKSGRVLINGKDIFDPTQPFWNGKAPIIKWPDL